MTAVGAGSVTITATTTSNVATARIYVAAPPVASIAVSAPSSVVTVGGSVQLIATMTATVF